jgi:DNA mismatch repair protein MutS
MKGMKDTPLNRQYAAVKNQYPDCLVFFRVGDFYEVFYEDARTVSRELNLVLTSRQEGQPMAGVPYHAVERYLKKLVEKGYKVAVCEQMEDPRTAKGIVKRDVVKVITPGTWVDEEHDNYLASFFFEGKEIGYAYVDIALGEVSAGHVESVQEIVSVFKKINPAEIIIPEGDTAAREIIKNDFKDVFVTTYPGWEYDPEIAINRIKRYFNVVSLVPFGIHDHISVIAAASILLKHVEETQKGVMNNISRIENESEEKYVGIDAKTWRNLEIFSPLYGGADTSLFAALNATETKMGERNLKKWLRKPLRDSEEMEKRWEAVDFLSTHRRNRERLKAFLSDIPDFEKALGKISYNRGRPRDLLQVKAGLRDLGEMKEELYGTGVALLEETASRMDPLFGVYDLIEKSISEDLSASVQNMNLIKKGFDPQIDELKKLKSRSKTILLEIQEKEKEATGIPTLKVKYNKVFGYFIEVSKSYAGKVPSHYERRQTLTGSERYIIPELKELEEKILSADEEIIRLEQEAFSRIRDEVLRFTGEILEDARAVGEVDTLFSFAVKSLEQEYVRPRLSEEDRLEIEDGRHPVVERFLKEEPFVPNDLFMDSRKRIFLVTGPNMAGKSTYLRQNALIILMAQIGCFVPARSMFFSPVDKIFSRVGASDNLAGGESTFMVEMLETSHIIHNATHESFVILDEIGRGTSTYDGLSLAWAITEYIHKSISARTLFATHYHELTELPDLYTEIHNLNIQVKEWNDKIVFLRKIEEGRADKSYGIQVARLAGLPDSVIDRAREILFNLESDSYKEGIPSLVYDKEQSPGGNVQGDLFSRSFHERIVNRLRYLDLNTLSPIELMFEIKKIKKEIDEEDSRS